MPLEIPPPDETTLGDMKFTWKATAEQRTIEEGNVVTIYKYEISHEDGTVTFRTVTDTNGEKSTEERRERRGAAPEPAKKPIEPPRGMPEHGTFDAKRVVFTDEENVVTTTINYTVYTEDGKWWQKEVHKDGQPIDVTKGPIEPLSEEDIKALTESPATEPATEPAPPQPDQAPMTIVIPPPRPAVKNPPGDEPVIETRAPEEPPPRRTSNYGIRSRGSVAERYLKNLK
ncbi:hypothetical protein CTAYLR_008802 [Chrysophaeum taylorii]|uniref:Uncharacterized protein n=1 Tax=Chrysophaeum taylorii TaxID=2483200 RepID=A0AAD7UKB1_9STRA|nr:hypothetical protein CTAYLR_008802 [Chrysophaeum taylorii]